MALQKGRFYNADTGAEVVACHFNPEDLTISKSNTWSWQGSPGSNLPTVPFGGEGPRTLSMRLVFDTYEARTDVRAATDLLVGLMAAPASNQSDSRPPHVTFGWGQFTSFRAVITSLSQTFSLFLEDGTPVRANVQVTLQEIPMASAENQQSGQNPTSHAAGARRARLVQAGDTIDLIASEEFGDPGSWRVIAEANNLDNPRRLRPGQRLLIPREV